MRKICLIVIMALLGYNLSAQGVLNVRINEVLVLNENDIVDDYGFRESWIELFNTGYEKVNLGGCFIGIRYADRFDAQGNKVIKKYYIPRNNPETQLEPLGYRLFFCEGTDTKGTFYTNFTLGQEPVDMVILYNANGKDVISVFEFPAGYTPVPDVALGVIGHDEIESKIFPRFSLAERKKMGDEGYLNAVANGLKYKPQVLSKTTPNATNEITADVSRDELFRRRDEKGVVMAMTAMAVVFSALVAIFLVFKIFGNFMVRRTNKTEAKSKGTKGEAPVEKKSNETSYTGEEIAAISLALRLYQKDLHVQEASIITINRVGRMYSPWSSKIYGLTEIPEKKNRK